MFGEPLSSKVIRTRGAIAYEKEVTCIITVPETHMKMFTSALEAHLIKGAFVMQQDITTPARWFKRLDTENGDEGAAAYYDRIVKTVAAQGGRLLYRPSETSSLGATGVEEGVDTGMIEIK